MDAEEIVRTMLNLRIEDSVTHTTARLTPNRRKPKPLDKWTAYTQPLQVYFIQASNGFIKIGQSIDPDRRLRGLQNASAERLKIIAVIKPANPTLERSLHARFSHLRRQGEWFRPGPDLIEYIQQLK